MRRNTGLKTRNLCVKFPIEKNPLGEAFPVGYYDVNTGFSYQSSYKNLRYLNLPKADELPLDLNAGIELAIKQDDALYDNYIANFLQFIMDNYSNLKKIVNEKSKESSPRNVLPIEFIFCRNMVTVMATPFEYRNNWKLYVTRFKGSHYIRQVETEEERFKRENKTDLHKRMCAWGYKFEQYCLSESPKIKPKTDVPVEEGTQFLCVFYNKLENVGGGLLYVSEIDGVRSSEPVKIDGEDSLKKLEFIELKTCARLTTDRERNNYRFYKTRNWWCQAYLTGIKGIIIGWRDEKGFIHDIEEISTAKLLEQGRMWCPEDCSQFLISFLQVVKILMQDVDCPHTVYEFTFDAKQSLVLYESFEGQTEKSFLTDSYINFLTEL